MKIAIMQPYFFPFFGYFQLINAVDKFVILDDVSFIKRGWINRNRILVNGKDCLITIPVKQVSQNKNISDTFISDDNKWQSKLLKTIELAYKHAPQFNNVFPLFENSIQNSEKNISKFIYNSLLNINQFLGIQTQVITSASIYNNEHLKGQERIIYICQREKATQYINPIGGFDLYSEESFKKHQIDLRFLKTLPIEYKQFSNEFVPDLSIIDLMMFVEKEIIQLELNNYKLIKNTSNCNITEKKLNILVFPCGSEIGLEVNRSLASSTHFKLYGANSVDDHGKYVYENYISGVPFIDASNFFDEINKTIELYSIDFIIPTHDSAVLKMAENRDLIKAIVITSAVETCKICRSKRKTYELFDNLIPTPKVYDLSENMNFPIFLKPDVGQGTKGTFRVVTKEEVDFYLKKDPTLLALEFLPGKEYTVDCFTDRNGKLLFAEGRERIRISDGISTNSKQTDNPKFQQLAAIINQTLSFQGVWFFQVKERVNGELVLMEIAPRIAGTMALFRVTGINFMQLSLFDRMCIEVSILNSKLDIEIDRALFARYSINGNYECVYIDLDDTIIFNNAVNTSIIKFIYQAKNMGKRIILLSRHNKDIKGTLSKFAISDLLFDDIIKVEQNENKSDYIKNINSIFIDDSFTERKKVFDRLNIPVFDVDAVEALINWKV